MKIHFPVLTRLKITGYDLFPGNGQGINHTFEPGVTVIVGINGLGKTTLLNVILNMLVGWHVPSKFDPADPGSGTHKMVTRESEYFTSRSADEAVDALIEADFSFGNDSITIKRKVSDFSIIALTLNGKAIKGDDDALQMALVHACGVATLYDFFYIVRYFTFFLEDKVSLIWNPKGQFEIFRILFFDATKGKIFAQYADNIIQWDSQYRTLRVPYNKLVAEFKKDFKRLGNKDSSYDELKLKQIEFQDLEDKDYKLRRTLEKTIDKRNNLRERIEKIKLEIEEDQRHLEGLLDSFFSRAFPKLPAIVANILNHLHSKAGCLVCGTTDPASNNPLLEKAKKGICPFCQTHQSAIQSQNLSKATEEEISNLERRIRKNQGLVKIDEQKLTHTNDLLVSEMAERSEQSIELINLSHEIEKLESLAPITQDHLTGQQKLIKEKEKELKNLKKKITEENEKYSKLLDEGRKAVEKVTNTIVKKFELYAAGFLAEKCVLTYEVEKRRVGQEDDLLEYPNFHVLMTSGVSPKTVTPRKNFTEVSESQKEFIDLAFRMALFDAVKQPQDGVMIVIETPEASLDSQFVKKAGSLLRQFATSGNTSKNVLIASCNLNAAGMVRSLLGVEEMKLKDVSVEVPKRLINLLELAAPNAALRADGSHYRGELKAATTK